MKTLVLFKLIFASLLYGAQLATITISNNCPYTIWPATLTGSGSQLSNTGYEAATASSNSLNIPPPWTGRIWARTQCNTYPGGRFSCATADCATGRVACNGSGAIPPATLLEFTLAAGDGTDFYDVSLVDGFNLPVSITPQGGSGPNCTAASCPADVNAGCPGVLAVNGADGKVISCKSACVAFNQPQYCCTGAFDTPSTCKPTNYSMIFKNQCPQAYSYAYDDPSSTFSCTGDANYAIKFCP